jgi:hypothetical protein
MPGLDLPAILPNRIHAIGFIVDAADRGEQFLSPTIQGNIQDNVRGNVWGSFDGPGQ